MGESQPALSIDFRDKTAILTPTLNEILDKAEVDKFRDSLEAFLKSHPNMDLVIDFSGVEWMCTSIMHLLLRYKKILQQNQHRLIVCAAENKIKDAPTDKFFDEIFKIYPQNRFLQMYPDLESAFDYLSPNQNFCIA